MNIDGEYRTAFIDDQAPDLNYGTAPIPSAEGYEDSYGGGYITGNIVGIGKGSKNPEAAWALIKYLTTDTDALVKLSNGLKNVPTTHDAIASPDLEVSEQFQTFLDIFENPKSSTTPPSAHRRRSTRRSSAPTRPSGSRVTSPTCRGCCRRRSTTRSTPPSSSRRADAHGLDDPTPTEQGGALPLLTPALLGMIDLLRLPAGA